VQWGHGEFLLILVSACKNQTVKILQDESDLPQKPMLCTLP
jgi:hypothetical protein